MRAIDHTKPRLPFDMDKHCNPSYHPWQQCVAVVPDGDLFAAIRSGKASVVADTSARFDATGIQLAQRSAPRRQHHRHCHGFQPAGFRVPFSVDGKPVDFNERVTYRGIMIEGIPNMAYVQGYFRSSWTLRADMACDLICRVIEHMRQEGRTVVEPVLPSARTPTCPACPG